MWPVGSIAPAIPKGFSSEDLLDTPPPSCDQKPYVVKDQDEDVKDRLIKGPPGSPLLACIWRQCTVERSAYDELICGM